MLLIEKLSVAVLPGLKKKGTSKNSRGAAIAAVVTRKKKKQAGSGLEHQGASRWHSCG
jgi:hypothetical protein